MNDETLQSFERLLTQTQTLILEENSLLKSGDLARHTELLKRKGELLKELELGIAELKDLRENKAFAPKDQLRTLQDRIMRVLMLDRENEQLLLKRSVGNFASTINFSASVRTLEKLQKNL